MPVLLAKKNTFQKRLLVLLNNVCGVINTSCTRSTTRVKLKKIVQVVKFQCVLIARR